MNETNALSPQTRTIIGWTIGIFLVLLHILVPTSENSFRLDQVIKFYCQIIFNGHVIVQSISSSVIASISCHQLERWCFVSMRNKIANKTSHSWWHTKHTESRTILDQIYLWINGDVHSPRRKFNIWAMTFLTKSLFCRSNYLKFIWIIVVHGSMGWATDSDL